MRSRTEHTHSAHCTGTLTKFCAAGALLLPKRLRLGLLAAAKEGR